MKKLVEIKVIEAAERLADSIYHDAIERMDYLENCQENGIDPTKGHNLSHPYGLALLILGQDPEGSRL